MNVLFLCTGNSARSILAEALLNELARGRHQAFSAGSRPAGRVNPGALEKLAAEGHVTTGLESKSWDRFCGRQAPRIDIVITLCDNAAYESCPVWWGEPVAVHWGIPDPAYFESDDAREAAFSLAYARLRRRIEAFLELPRELAHEDLEPALERIHEAARAADIAGA